MMTVGCILEILDCGYLEAGLRLLTGKPTIFYSSFDLLENSLYNCQHHVLIG